MLVMFHEIRFFLLTHIAEQDGHHTCAANAKGRLLSFFGVAQFHLFTARQATKHHSKVATEQGLNEYGV